MDKKLKLEWLDPKTLAPNPKNYREHPEKQKQLLDGVLQEVGWAGVALFNRTTGNLIDGHARRDWAIEHDEELPVLIGEWDEKDEHKILATLDPIAAMAQQNDEIYRELLEGMDARTGALKEWAEKVYEALNPPCNNGLTDPDEAPKVEDNPISRLGDVWILGGHRLVCGDSTDADTVKKCLNGVAPHLMVTDPPYGVEYDANKARMGSSAKGKVLNDNQADWTEAWALFPGHIAYVWHADRHCGIVFDSLVKNGFVVRAQIIWAKSTLVFSRGDYHSQHEPCFYAVKGTGNWTGDRKQSTLWQIDKPRKSETGHSTQKPVECMRRPMENNSSPGQAVYEPFSGSGTTIIAGEQIGRHVYAIELNPAYVDMAIVRWQNFTGEKAVLDGDGRTFEEVGLLR